MDTQDFVPGISPTAADNKPAWWFAFHKGSLLVQQTDGAGIKIPCVADIADLGVTTVRRVFIGTLADANCYAVELEQGEAPAGFAFESLWQVYEYGDTQISTIAGIATQIVDWDRTHQFCGQCGTRTEQEPGLRAKKCPACGFMSFPRISPAIITLVRRGDEVLLARGRGFPEGFYSTIAGFVEAGETLEHAVVREVREETGVAVTNIRYFGSQPWPFPNSLMLGFLADYASGEIVVDPAEIADAKWFTADTMPHIPGKFTIARSLIDTFLNNDA